MRSSLMALLAILTAISLSAIHRPMWRISRASRPCKMVRSVSWKQIAASGAAAGTVIAAYKISNGVEDGIRTVAKEKPEEFAGILSVVTWPIRWGLLLALAGGGYWLFRKFHRKHKENQNAGGSSEE